MSRSGSRMRNERNSNPYNDHDKRFVAISNSAAGSFWRWRTELILTAVLVFAAIHLADLIDTWWTLVVFAAASALVFGLPIVRRWVIAHAWCTISRHRLQRLFHEVHRLHTKSGRLPLVCWIRPTPVGERAFLWLRAGICFEDFESHISEIRTACYARDARVQANPRWTHLITVNIVRRDTLAADTTIVPLIRDRRAQAASDA